MTQQYIDVIQAHMRGEKIELRDRRGSPECPPTWFSQPGEPLWNFANYEYRIAPEPKIPDSICWSHVVSGWNFMARDKNGDAWLYDIKPSLIDGGWGGNCSMADASNFASYKHGNMEWQDSLVERPKP